MKEKGAEMDNWIDTRTAARITGYSQEYIRELARAGKIEHKKIGQAVVINTESLLEPKRSTQTTRRRNNPCEAKSSLKG